MRKFPVYYVGFAGAALLVGTASLLIMATAPPVAMIMAPGLDMLVGGTFAGLVGVLVTRGLLGPGMVFHEETVSHDSAPEPPAKTGADNPLV
jgi:hypothetical protein